jgi:hypothetical protein
MGDSKRRRLIVIEHVKELNKTWRRVGKHKKGLMIWTGALDAQQIAEQRERDARERDARHRHTWEAVTDESKTPENKPTKTQKEKPGERPLAHRHSWIGKGQRDRVDLINALDLQVDKKIWFRSNEMIMSVKAGQTCILHEVDDTDDELAEAAMKDAEDAEEAMKDADVEKDANKDERDGDGRKCT